MDPMLTVLMHGPNHALLLDEEAEVILEDDVYVRDAWVKRVTEGWPTRDLPDGGEC